MHTSLLEVISLRNPWVGLLLSFFSLKNIIQNEPVAPRLSACSLFAVNTGIMRMDEVVIHAPFRLDRQQGEMGSLPHVPHTPGAGEPRVALTH